MDGHSYLFLHVEELGKSLTSWCKGSGDGDEDKTQKELFLVGSVGWNHGMGWDGMDGILSGTYLSFAMDRTLARSVRSIPHHHFIPSSKTNGKYASPQKGPYCLCCFVTCTCMQELYA